jgi:para-nitrobenzyl esterase
MSSPIVETAAGKVEGKRAPEGDVLMFRGIPYAAPPTGPTRVRAPQPAPPGTEPRDAPRFGPAAPQVPGVMEQLYGNKLTTDEDCLTLNVWTPAADAGRRPVMVWIHGGAFLSGTGSIPWYDGRTFVRSSDVVVVTINYRLGALGFLHLADLGGEAFASSGNVGLLDQVAALTWVRDNIGSFGGDSGNVTVFGESAGAFSIGSLLGLPAARDLFGRAILQSGASSNVSDRETATSVAVRLLGTLGLSADAAGVAKLRDVPAAKLLEAQDAVVNKIFNNHRLPFQPVVDGTALPRPPLDAIADGSADRVAVICGTNLEEMRLFTLLDTDLASGEEEALVRRSTDAFGAAAVGMIPAYREARPGASTQEIFVALTSDLVFRIPAIRLLERQSLVNADCYSYLFTMRSTSFGGGLGASHVMEIPFVFNNLDRPGVALFTGEPPGSADLAGRMHTAWAAFARSGDPNHPGIPVWPRYDTGRRATMEFGSDCRVIDDPSGAERALWEALV